MKRTPGEYTIGPAYRLKRLFGWTAERRSVERLNPNPVPQHLRDLIPLAERWGVTCDIARHDVGAKASDRELKHLSQALAGRHDDIVDWLYSFESARPREAAIFSAMLVFELEECDGQGIPGLFGWAYRKHVQTPTLETLRRLRDAYHFAEKHDVLKYEPTDIVANARQILGLGGA